MKYTSKLILNWTEYEFGAGGGGWWQPWANTIAYYPLTSTSTVNDMSGNNNTLTNRWAIFTTLLWVDCADINNNGFYISSWFTLNTETISCWFNLKNGNIHNTIIKQWSSFWQNVFGVWYRPSLWLAITDWWWSWTKEIIVSWDLTVWQWYHLVLTQENWKNWKMYLNWNLYTSWWDSRTTTPDWPFYIWYSDINPSNTYWYNYISEVIIENKVRTAQEISNYFNQTKSLYWIS